jgi:hypothetical protein
MIAMPGATNKAAWRGCRLGDLHAFRQIACFSACFDLAGVARDERPATFDHAEVVHDDTAAGDWSSVRRVETRLVMKSRMKS